MVIHSGNGGGGGGGGGGAGLGGHGIRLPVDAELARQDALRACNPEIERPFASFEDACHRLLVFHVLADDDSDDVKDIVVDSTGRVLSYSRYWNEALATKIKEHQSTFRTQLDLFNSLSKKRTEGAVRVEEDIMVEHLLLQDERRKMMDVKEEADSMRRAREEEAKMKELIVAAERIRAMEHQRQQALSAQEQVRLPEMGGAYARNDEPHPIVGTMQDSSSSANEATQDCRSRPPLVRGQQHPHTSVLVQTTSTSGTMQGASYDAPPIPGFQMHEVESSIETQDSAMRSNHTSHGQYPYSNAVPATATTASSTTTTSMLGGPSFQAPRPSGLQMHDLVDNSYEMQERGSCLNLNGSFQEPNRSSLPSFLQGKTYPFLPLTAMQGTRSSLVHREVSTTSTSSSSSSSSSVYRDGPTSSAYHAPPLYCFQVQTLSNGVGSQDAQRVHPASGFPDQEGMVEDLLHGWDEDRNESMNLLALHGSSSGGDGGGLMLDLNSLTSMR